MGAVNDIACPHCGMEYKLSAEAVREFGGGPAECSQCGGTFLFPTGVASADDQRAVAQGGHKRAAEPAPSAWRDGPLMILRRSAILPDVCFKCGAPAHGDRVKLNLVWSESGAPIRPGFVRSITFMLTRKHAAVELPVCEHHRRRRRTAVIIATCTSIVGGVAAASGIIGQERHLIPENIVPFLAMGGFFLFMAPILVMAFWMPWVTPKEIRPSYLTLEGAGEAFLKHLPRLDGNRP